MKLTEQEQANYARAKAWYLSKDTQNSGSILLHEGRDSIYDLLRMIDRLAQEPDCTGYIHQGEQFKSTCPDCVRRGDTRPDRHERKEQADGT
ncbi:MAG: hypothetical protein ABFC56_09775 [Clostridiaceae bacterium]